MKRDWASEMAEKITYPLRGRDGNYYDICLPYDVAELLRTVDAEAEEAAKASNVKFARAFQMPNADTFSMPMVGDWVKMYLAKSTVSVDPFARNKRWATHTNDIDPTTAAEHHMEAGEFCELLAERGVVADLIIFDPPYSPRQVSEVYKSAGLSVSMEETQTGALYRRVRDAADKILKPGGVCLSFGWNSMGMGVVRGYETLEILLIQHGGAHNDTICMAERKSLVPAGLFDEVAG